MKKLISILLVAVFLSLFTLTAYAENRVYIYNSPDGEKIEYFLDENGNPYNYSDGKKVYLAIGLEHLTITDERLLEVLDDSLATINTEKNEQQRYTPTNYVYLPPSDGNPLMSDVDSRDIEFTGASYISTPIYWFYGNHNILWIRASDIEKVNDWGSSKISYTFSYYSIGDDRWYSQYHPEVNLHSNDAEVFSVSFSVYPYGYLWFWDDGNILSFVSNVWTSAFF